jgi:hypothetical protein
VDIGKSITVKWGELWGKRTRREGNQEAEQRQVGHGRTEEKTRKGSMAIKIKRKGSVTLTTWHPLSATFGTNIFDKRRSLGLYSSLWNSGHGVLNEGTEEKQSENQWLQKWLCCKTRRQERSIKNRRRNGGKLM